MLKHAVYIQRFTGKLTNCDSQYKGPAEVFQKSGRFKSWCFIIYFKVSELKRKQYTRVQIVRCVETA